MILPKMVSEGISWKGFAKTLSNIMGCCKMYQENWYLNRRLKTCWMKIQSGFTHQKWRFIRISRLLNKHAIAKLRLFRSKLTSKVTRLHCWWPSPYMYEHQGSLDPGTNERLVWTSWQCGTMVFYCFDHLQDFWPGNCLSNLPYHFLLALDVLTSGEKQQISKDQQWCDSWDSSLFLINMSNEENLGCLGWFRGLYYPVMCRI